MMNQSFIYQHSDEFDNLIDELRQSPIHYVSVPIGKQKVPMLDRLIVASLVFLGAYLVFFLPIVLIFTPIAITMNPDLLGASVILMNTVVALIAALVAFFTYRRRDEYKKVRKEDLTYYDLARILAKRENLQIDGEPDILEPVDENLDDSTIKGVIFWMRRVQGEGEVVPGRISYDNLENSIKYLSAIERHSTYKPNASILEGISKTLQRYDSLVNDEIPTPKVVQLLRKIELKLSDYENVCREMYEDAIENDLMETEIHLATVDTQVRMKGLGKDDFSIDEEIPTSEMPKLIKKR